MGLVEEGISELKKARYEEALYKFKKAYKKQGDVRSLKLMGITYLEMFELEKAAEVLQETVEREGSAENYFLLSIAYMLMDNDKSGEMLKKALEKDRKRTKKLLEEFYKNAIKGRIGERKEKRIEEKLRAL